MPNRPPQHNAYVHVEKRLETQRNNDKAKRYGNDWKKLRYAFLRENPLCDMCMKQDKVVAATVVHHIIDIVKAPERRLDWDNLQALCVEHHNAITASRMHGN